MDTRQNEILRIERERQYLEAQLKRLSASIGAIPIANNTIMPYGWRKAAKGRTVWRIVEEVISQNLEKNASSLGFNKVVPTDTEVGVWDFKFIYGSGEESYVNIKSSVNGGRRNKDDLSKAEKLVEFYKESPGANLYIATFVLDFLRNMTVSICDAVVFPISWIPDIYVNPSNNGNLQSAYYKDLSTAVKRTNAEFIKELHEEIAVANQKKRDKAKKNT